MSVLVAAVVAFGVLPAPRGEAAIPAHGRSYELTTILRTSTSSGIVGMRPMRDEINRIVYTTIGPPPGSPSGSTFGYGTSLRGPSGWLSTPLGYPYDINSTELFVLLAPCRAVLETSPSA